MKKLVVSILFFIICMGLYGDNSLENYIVDRKVEPDGSEIIGIQVPGGRPPEGYVRKEIVDIETLKTNRNVVIIDDVPAFDWSYGCAATSAAIIAAYYDRNGYPNIYTGPTNGGVMPLNNSVWNEGSGGEGGDGECPLSATHQGFDGLTSRGHVDNYWLEYGSELQDPYITNGWTPHTNANCTGDYMATNQSYWSNSDGGTTYYNNNDGSPLHSFSQCESYNPPRKDGSRGYEQFMESRGYDVTVSYNQKIYGYEGNTQGFTFAQYMAEIDANRPVLLQVVGHAMVGFGYDSSNQTIYIKNTWDYSTHTMTWGGEYSGMTHYAVSILNLDSSDIVVNGDSFSDAIPVNSLPFATTGNTDYYTNTIGNTANDVFYKILLSAPANDVTINTNGSAYDTVLRIYNSSQTEIYSDDDGGEGNWSELTGLSFAANTEYYICVEGYGNYSGMYHLNIILEGQEFLTLECNDSYGDGWNGNSVSVSVNGAPVVNNFTFTDGFQATTTFGVFQGDAVATTFTEGNWSYECSYRILDSNGTELGAGDDATDISFIYGNGGTPSVLPPTNLTASVVNDNNVELHWDAPLDLSEGTWITKGAESNSDGIGTGSAAVISVAHMYTQADLAMYQGQYINSIKFFPREATSSYTLKVWGGFDGNTELYSQAVTNFVNEAWNELTLYSSVAIPSTGPLYIGYVANTPTGYPCGSDAGPAVAGGDMIKLDNQANWDILSDITTIDINWNIQAFVSSQRASRVSTGLITKSNNTIKTVKTTISSQLKAGKLSPIATTRINNTQRDVSSYKIYRDNVQIAEVGSTIIGFVDQNLEDGSYVYHVTAMYESIESLSSNSVTVNINSDDPEDVLFEDSFETYPDFAIEADPWVLIDGDLSTTYGFQGITFENSGSAMSYIVFNPSMTNPPLEDAANEAYDGSKYMACFAATAPNNNDWMITQEFTLGASGLLSFWGKSVTDQYGLERFNVLVSDGSTNPTDFTSISGASHVEAPIDWTEFTYSLDAYANQSIRVAIQCVSSDAFIFMVDDFKINSTGGEIIVPDELLPPTNLTASVSEQSVTLNWQAPSRFGDREPINELIQKSSPSGQKEERSRDFTGYNIYRDGTVIATISSNMLTYVDNNLAYSSYDYYITAVYTNGESEPTNIVTVEVIEPEEVLPPTNLTASVNDDDVTLNWQAPMTETEIETDVIWTDEVWTSFVNDGQPYAIRVDNNDNYDKPLTEIGFALYSSGGNITGTATVYAWSNSAGLPGTQLASVTGVSGMVSQAWMNVDMSSENIVVPSNGSIFVGVGGFSDDNNTQGLLADNTTTEYGSFTNVQGSWTALNDAYTGLGNVGIKATILEASPTQTLADNYNIYRDESLIVTLPSNVLTYLDTNLEYSTYDYYVTALYTNSESEPSNTVTVEVIEPELILPPTNLTASVNDDDITLNWLAPSREVVRSKTVFSSKDSKAKVTRDLTGYKIYRDESLIATLTSNVLTFVDGNLDYATYEYYVTALYTDNESEPSNTVTVEVIEPELILPPTNFTAVVVNEMDVQVNWDAPNARVRTLKREESLFGVESDNEITRDLTGYTLYRDDEVLAEVGTNVMSYLDEDLDYGTYEYYAIANYDEADSDPTSTVTVVLEEEEEILAPMNLTSTVMEDAVTLNWDAPGTEAPETMNESFENGFPPADWTTVVNNTTESWAHYEEIVFTSGNVTPTDGMYQAGVMWDYAAQDEWLITGEMSGITGLTFDFYGQYGSTNADNYYVKVSTDGGSDWTAVWNATDLPAAENHYDTPVSIDLSAYASDNINIAWNFVDGDGAGLWYATYIDNIMFETAVATRAIKTSELVTFSKAIKTPVVRNNRDLTGYTVYRDDEEIATLAATVLTYVDEELANGVYEYYVTAMYGDEESEASNTVTATVNVTIPGDYFLEDSFETYTDFALEAGAWTMFDGDLSTTYGFTGITFENSGLPMAFIVFNPEMTTPALDGADYVAADGSKYLASFAATTPTNNDWLMTPAFTLGATGTFNFWAKSLTADYGLERFNVLVSDGSTNPDDFTSISGATYTEAPLDWTQYSYSLDAYESQTIRVAIQTVSNDAFVFMVDQIQIEAPDAVVGNADNQISAVSQLKGNYPNPFNPETTIAFSTKEKGPVSIDIYNIKGQKVRSLLNENREAGAHSVVWNGRDNNGKSVASGVFFYRMKSGKYSSTKKMILMK